MRQRAHVDGDWHCSVYLDLTKAAAKLDKARTWAKHQLLLPHETVEDSRLEHLRQYHVSLSKSLYLKGHQLKQFEQAVRKEVG